MCRSARNRCQVFCPAKPVHQPIAEPGFAKFNEKLGSDDPSRLQAGCRRVWSVVDGEVPVTRAQRWRDAVLHQTHLSPMADVGYDRPMPTPCWRW
jgi:hypothetical protein